MCVFALSLISVGCSTTPDLPGKAGVATAHPLATQAAFRTLDRGGNAFDAAIAAAATLAVVEPYSSGMGGGGFWLLQKRNGDTSFIDAREKAPLDASRDMYLDARGYPVPSRSKNGALAAAIPGQAAAFDHIARHHGRLPLNATLQDAIQLAEDGFKINRKYRDMVHFRLDELRKHQAAASTFLENGQIPGRGFVVKQPALAKTLRALAARGKAGFYQGEVAINLVRDVRKAGGIWRMEDLAGYNVVEREPVQFVFHGKTRVTTVGLPSSGGIALQQMLGIMEGINFSDFTPAQVMMAKVAVMDEAFRNQAAYMGDSDFVSVPVKDLTRKTRLNYLARTIRKNISQSGYVADWQTSDGQTSDGHTEEKAGLEASDEHEYHGASHIAVIDKYGNRASVTLGLNLPFGSGFMSRSTGVVLNNEMDDFSINPGRPDARGLTGNEQNAIAPGKRPLSSMSPGVVESDQRVAVIGSSGGSRIITMVFQAILAITEGRNAQETVTRPRYHFQHRPEYIQYEKGAIPADVIKEMRLSGYAFKPLGRRYGNMQMILLDKQTGKLEAATDPRGAGQAIVRN
ncbi:MAG: gamma-glutamyltransferase [Proteobacteria bacterium]|nr:MAG: gamma-glutamyltransferase [Pseudomonadota bacterium]